MCRADIQTIPDMKTQISQIPVSVTYLPLKCELPERQTLYTSPLMLSKVYENQKVDLLPNLKAI